MNRHAVWAIHLCLAIAGFTPLLAQEDGTSTRAVEPTVAVLPFENLSTRRSEVLETDQRGVWWRLIVDRYGASCRESIEHELINLGGVGVVERKRIDQAVQEIALNESGLVDTRTALAAGKLLRADYILSGSLLQAELESSSSQAYGIQIEKKTMRVRIRVKLLDVEKGQLVLSKYLDGAVEVKENQFQDKSLDSADARWSLFQKAVEDAHVAARKKKVFSNFFSGSSPSSGATVILTFEPEPEGCDLEVDGLLEGTTPCDVEATVGQKLKIRLSRAGYEPWEKTIQVREKHGGMPFKPRLGKKP